jgi:hypothetical protein
VSGGILRFQVYLNLPEGAAPDPKGINYVGNFSFFGRTPATGRGPSACGQVFDITELVKRQTEQGGVAGGAVADLRARRPAARRGRTRAAAGERAARGRRDPDRPPVAGRLRLKRVAGVYRLPSTASR